MNFSTHDQWRVLLIDRDSRKQQLRAVALRNCEVEVHTASNISDAGSLWTRHSYDLVLFAAEEHSDEVILLCSELKRSKPRQRVALLVGAPQYVREVGSKGKNPQPADTSPAPGVVIGATHAQRTQWQGTVEHLLAAG